MSPRRRRSTALAAAVATVAALGTTALVTVTVGASTASAAQAPLKDYTLTWGVKESYRTYVVQYARGSFTPAGGVTQAADNGAFTFTGGTGTYDTEQHTVDLAFPGSLVSASTAHHFAVTLSDVRFDSAAGEITADVKKVDTSGETPRTTEGDDVPLATVAVTRDLTDMATTLTAEAGEYLGSAGYAGAAGDPLTVTRAATPTPSTQPTTTEPTAQPSTNEPSASGSPTGKPSPSRTPTTAPSPTTPGVTTGPATSPAATATPTASQAPVKGAIAKGTLGWGVKDSFRAYVVGPIAKGTVSVSGGASQAAGNGAFTFGDATGTYDTDTDRLTASFRGAVTFKGHESGGTYGLDLTLSGFRATLDGGKGTLSADVTSLGEKTPGVVLADLKAASADLTARDGVLAVDGVAATLTKAGAEAFGGFYPAGTALDPVRLALALDDDARLPGGGTSGGAGGTGTVGGGGTSGALSGGTGSTVGGVGSTTGGIGGGSLATTGSDLPVAALGTGAAVAVAAGAGVVHAVRRRRTRA